MVDFSGTFINYEILILVKYKSHPWLGTKSANKLKLSVWDDVCLTGHMQLSSFQTSQPGVRAGSCNSYNGIRNACLYKHLS